MEKFVFNETYYANLLTRIEAETKLQLTEFEAGLCRAILDIKTKGDAGACLGDKYKAETKRLIAKGLIHKPTFQYTGVCVPTGKLKEIIEQFMPKHKTVLTFETHTP